MGVRRHLLVLQVHSQLSLSLLNLNYPKKNFSKKYMHLVLKSYAWAQCLGDISVNTEHGYKVQTLHSAIGTSLHILSVRTNCSGPDKFVKPNRELMQQLQQC